MRSQPKARKTPKKLRIQRTVGKAIVDSIPDPHLLLVGELPGVQWAEAAWKGSDVRIWQPHKNWYVQYNGGQHQIDESVVTYFRGLLQKAINFHDDEEILRQLRYRRNILDVWLEIGVIDRLAGLSL